MSWMSIAANTSISQIAKNNMMSSKIICHFKKKSPVNWCFVLTSLSVLSPAQESHVTMDLPPVSEQIMQTLSELARSFQDTADRCLLVLHLEVRYDTVKRKSLELKALWVTNHLRISEVSHPNFWFLLLMSFVTREVIFRVTQSLLKLLSTCCILNNLIQNLHVL